MSSSKVQIIKQNGQWYFRVVKNGKIICHSEKYTRKSNAESGAILLMHIDWDATEYLEPKKRKRK